MRELAAFASLGFRCWQFQNGKTIDGAPAPNDLSWTSLRPGASWETHQWAELERLWTVEDAEVRAAVAKVRPILASAYRLKSAQLDLGYQGESSKHTVEAFGAILAYGISEENDPPESQQIIHYSNGRTVTIDGPKVQSEETSQALDHAIEVLMDTKGKDEKEFSRTLLLAFGDEQDAMAKIWESAIFPKLQAAAAKKPVPAFEIGVTTDVNRDAYGAVAFGNPREKLTNVAVRVTSRDTRGDAMSWYAYFAELLPGHLVTMETPENFWFVTLSAPSLIETFSLVCDQGQKMDVPVDPGANLSPDHETIESRLKRLAPSRAKAPQLKQVFAETYPLCQTPGAVRASLIAALGQGKTWTPPAEKQVRLACLPFDDQCKLVQVNLSVNDDAGRMTTAYSAQLLPEVERGAVLGFYREAISSAPPVGGPVKQEVYFAGDDLTASRLLTSPTEIADFREYKKAKEVQRIHTDADKRLGPAAGMIFGYFHGDVLNDGPSTLHSDEKTVESLGVLSLDAKGRLWLQTAPDTEAKVQRIALTPLPAPEQPPAPSPTPEYFATLDEARREAARRYPELSEKGSAFNNEFVARFKKYQKERPAYFGNNAWPVTLAREVHEAMGTGR